MESQISISGARTDHAHPINEIILSYLTLGTLVCLSVCLSVCPHIFEHVGYLSVSLSSYLHTRGLSVCLSILISSHTWVDCYILQLPCTKSAHKRNINLYIMSYYIYIYIYIYAYTYTYTHTRTHARARTHTHIYICMYICIYICGTS